MKHGGDEVFTVSPLCLYSDAMLPCDPLSTWPRSYRREWTRESPYYNIHHAEISFYPKYKED